MSLIIASATISFIGGVLVMGFLAGLIYGKYYYDNSECDGSRKWPRIQKILASVSERLQSSYFTYSVTYRGNEGLKALVKEHQTEKQAMFVGAPHGLLAISSLFLVGIPLDQRKEWRNVVPCVHRHVFAVPFLRDVALWLGAIDVSRSNIEKILTHNKSIYIASGGCREMIIDPENEIQKKHTGFLKIAYEKKIPVFPVIHKGQDQVFRSYTFPWMDRIRHRILDMTGYPFPTFFAGPFPQTLTSFVFDPHYPQQYATENAFIEDYFKKLSECNTGPL
jgi:1-acyl-sn-glycerol-3-phosphate acyltransferase